MNFKHIFHEAVGDLSPGEKRIRTDLINNVRDLSLIKIRIDDLQHALNNSIFMAREMSRNPEMSEKLQQIKQKVERKIQLLKRAMRRFGSKPKIFAILDEECSEFIAGMQQANKLLYRGINSQHNVFEGRSRHDRKPRDSFAYASKIYDRMMTLLGVKALRSNSIFTTSARNVADNYGASVYMIFPKNGFEFLNTNQQDLVIDEPEQVVDPSVLKEKLLKLDHWALINIPDWTSNSVHSYIANQDWFRAWFNIDMQNLGLPQDLIFDHEDLATPQHIARKFKPNTTNLVDAIRSGNEVLINGEYWALKRDVWYSAINQHYFGGKCWN